MTDSVFIAEGQSDEEKEGLLFSQWGPQLCVSLHGQCGQLCVKPADTRDISGKRGLSSRCHSCLHSLASLPPPLLLSDISLRFLFFVTHHYICLHTKSVFRETLPWCTADVSHCRATLKPDVGLVWLQCGTCPELTQASGHVHLWQCGPLLLGIMCWAEKCGVCTFANTNTWTDMWRKKHGNCTKNVHVNMLQTFISALFGMDL